MVKKKKGPKKKVKKKKHWSKGLTLAEIEMHPKFPGYLE